MDYDRDVISARPAESGDTVISLIRQLTEQAAQLAQQQAELIRAEVSESVNGLKLGVASMAGAAVVAIAGLGVLLMGLAYALAEVMELWAATLIVAVATLLLALVMFMSGRKKMTAANFDVERSRRTIARAPSAVTGHADGIGRS